MALSLGMNNSFRRETEMTQFATTRDHVSEYARNHGALEPLRPYILSPFDTWEVNPFFVGPRPPHPESGEEEINAWIEENGPINYSGDAVRDDVVNLEGA